MSALNGLIAMVGFKIPELVDPAFLGSLPRDDSRNQKVDPPSEAIAALSLDFGALAQLEPQQRGYAFEIFLNTLFKVYGLDPRQPFRLVGEQIDGSFQLNDDTYLAEARWRNQQADAADLAVLSTKVAGKAQWSRGIYISYAGFTADGLTAFARGKSTNVICVDGLDLVHILQGGLDLVDVLRRKARRAAETNDAFVPVRDLFMGVT